MQRPGCCEHQSPKGSSGNTEKLICRDQNPKQDQLTSGRDRYP